ncbi:hypothetical protein [Chryseobacterium daeguense]|uniref:hypothetical protein n=1 Tax=Chryseobacterium daeguense TaxID=412438 RepID=UPI000487EB9C|nr:hypothetical protein [Chryseobacterium daeguense]
MNICYKIGEKYQYPNDPCEIKYKLLGRRNYVFVFDGGHWCTDNVFLDLIRCKTGVQVYKETTIQLEIEF